MQKKMKLSISLSLKDRKFLFVGLAVLCLLPIVSPPLALLTGIVFAQFVEHPFIKENSKTIHFLLQFSVVGLGFGMNMHSALQAGKEGLIFTVVSITGTLVLGFLLGKFLRNNKIISFLISGGTAICGGSAIAALAPVVEANEHQVSVSLGTVYILNAAALFLFPMIGHSLHLSQTQFGLWCAIAIHDTSSVVGAAAKYGGKALGIATTVKLARALWIIPVALIASALFKKRTTSIKIPYFIGLFVLAIIVSSYVPVVAEMSHYIVSVSKSGLTLTLFLIGAGLSGNTLKIVGWRPIVQGLILWGIISVSTLLVLLHF